MTKARNYKLEYQNYQGKPSQIANRAARNAARAAYEKEHGDLPRNVDVDHRKPIAKGGTNASSNLRAQSQTSNRSFRRDSRARMK